MYDFVAFLKKERRHLSRKSRAQTNSRVLSDFCRSFPNEDICNKELAHINEETIHKPNIWKQNNNSKICEVILKSLFGNNVIYFPIQHFSHVASKIKAV